MVVELTSRLPFRLSNFHAFVSRSPTESWKYYVEVLKSFGKS